MICRHCGHENPNDTVFCPRCGTKIVTADAAPQAIYQLRDTRGSPPGSIESPGRGLHAIGLELSGWVLATLLPPIGLLVGIILVAVGRKAIGLIQMGLSVATAALYWWLFRSLIT